jgi:hypothetical protein
MKPAYLNLDNLDDRREVHQLLERLSPAARVEFLAWACRQCTLPNSRIHPQVSRRTVGTALEVYFDLWILAVDYHLDMQAVVNELAERVRTGGTGRRFLHRAT